MDELEDKKEGEKIIKKANFFFFKWGILCELQTSIH